MIAQVDDLEYNRDITILLIFCADLFSAEQEPLSLRQQLDITLGLEVQAFFGCALFLSQGFFAFIAKGGK